jgi:multidrug resistance efflux pump
VNARTKLVAGILAIALVAAGVYCYANFPVNKSVQAHQILPSDVSEVIFAAPGRVEGLSDTIEVGAAADGVLKTISVTEDQFVKKGTLMGEIACDDLQAALKTSLAEADAARQARVRLLRGTRDEEKRVASKKTAAAQAMLAEARAQSRRQRVLYKGGEISRADYDRASRDFGVARAEFQAAVRSERLLAAPPLPEDKARADAEVMAAESRVEEAQERIKKCAILAPIDGTVLRVNARPGESFSTVTPRPLFILADASGRRVKAEVDERDLAQVVTGQKVIIQGEGLAGKKLIGSVESTSMVMGKKRVFADDPADKIDRDVLEVTINFGTEDAKALPIGLRVTVQFLAKRKN